MPDQEELMEAELTHNFHLILCHAPERVVAMIGPSTRLGAVAIAAQVACHHGEELCQLRRDLMPGHVRQRVPVQEQEPWAGAAIAQVDRDLWVTGLELDMLETFKHVRV